MEFILLLILVALVYLIYIVRAFFVQINELHTFYEKQYFVFSKEEIEKAFQFFNEQNQKLKLALEKIEKEKITEENEELFREYKKQEIYTSRVKERLSLMIESNLSVLNGKKKIQEVIGAPLEYWLDSMSKNEERQIDEFISKIKK